MIPLKTIAIVDDHASELAVLKTTLDTLGYSVVATAAEGATAIEMAKREKPQVILMDLHMPKMDGLTALKTIAPARQSVVIMLTGDSDLHRVHEALQCGASGYIQKPYSAGQLAAVLESTWFQVQAAIAARIEFEALKESLEVRKLTEKAKGILMEQQGFSENEAHRCLQKMSQDQGIPLKEVCRSLIQVRMVLGQTGSRKVAMKPLGGH